MGVGKIKRQIQEETGIWYTERDILIFKEKSKEQNISIIDYIKSKDNSEVTDLIKTINGYENEFKDLTNWEDENTRRILGKLYFSDFGSLSRDVRNLLTKQGKDVSNIYFNTSNKFFSVIKEIKNNQLFWVLFGWFYQTFELTSLKQKEFKDILTKERLKVGFYERTLLTNTLLMVNLHHFAVNESGVTKVDSLEEGIQKCISSRIKKNKHFYKILFNDNGFKTLLSMGNEDEVKVWRGFKVDISDKEMKIMDKENNKQITGGGLSYSLNKKESEFFSFRWSFLDEIMRFIQVGIGTEDDDYDVDDINLTREKSEELLSFLVRNNFQQHNFFKDKKYRDSWLNSSFVKSFVKDSKNLKLDIDNELSQRLIRNYNINTRGYVGEYTCKRGDILMYSVFGFESECVVFQKNVKMMNYKVTTIDRIKEHFDRWSKKNFKTF